MPTMTAASRIQEYLGADADKLLSFQAKVDKSHLHVPGPDFVDRVWANSDRNPQVLRSLQNLFDHGRLGGTGYLSILPVDQGIEHSGGASFAKNPIYFDGENIVKLAIEGGCNAVATTFGVLGSVARKYCHRIPFIVKLNHNELLTYPNAYDQVLFGTVEEAWNLGATAVGATIYFGSDQNPAGRSRRSRTPSLTPMSSAWPPSSGATCGTAASRWTAPTITSPPISPVRRITSG